MGKNKEHKVGDIINVTLEIKKAFIEGFERGAEWGIDKDWYV